MRRIGRLWRWLRRLAGEDDYARYCAHLRARHPGKQLPTAKEFYLEQVNNRYARILDRFNLIRALCLIHTSAFAGTKTDAYSTKGVTQWSN